jgi:hypothetical protein
MDDPAYLAARAGDEDPGDGLSEDPGDAPPPDVDEDELIAEAERITGEQAREAAVLASAGLTAAVAADAAASAGRRGPGMPGSARSVPGVYASRASGFASGKPLDTAPGCLTLASFAEEAAGEDDRYPGASDDELVGAICAWDRVEAYASSRKHAAATELLRRRPAPGAAVQGPAEMPVASDEFVLAELAAALGETRAAAGDIVSLAQELEVSLPGTKAAFRAGIVSRRKAVIIACATVLLDPAEARAAEAMVLGRAGTLTPPGLRAAIARAVMDVAPGKATKRREHEAEKTRVERWAEASGNAGLTGMRSGTAARGPRSDGNRTGMIRRVDPGLPLSPPISPAQSTGTALGGSPPGSTTCSSRSGRCRPGSVTTGGKPGAMIPG